MVGRQNAHIADTLHLRDVVMATTFWLSMGYNFGCMMLFDSRGGFSGSSSLMKLVRSLTSLFSTNMATVFSGL